MSSARVPIAIRVATMDDLPWMDALQKRHSKQLGYFPTKQFEGYIEGGHVLVAEACGSVGVSGCRSENPDTPTPRHPDTSPVPLGYCISKDRYLKRDELGVIYQLCVVPSAQRGLIGATLVREVFERSAYGCRLFCCWCAQDLAANYFWESLGFVPLAFRVGSGKKKRLHIFWQRRIDADRVSDSSDPSSRNPNPETRNPTPYWYPFQTSSGAIRADRLVFPIPPGVRWQDVKAIELPRGNKDEGGRACPELVEGMKDEGKTKTLPAPRARSGSSLRQAQGRLFIPHPSSLPQPHLVAIIVGGRVKYVPKPGVKPPEPEKVEKPKRVRKAKGKEALTFDPRFLKQNRELRDRYLERVNAEPMLLEAAGKYDVSRALPSVAAKDLPERPTKRLPAA